MNPTTTTAPQTTATRRRLEAIIERVNRLHCRRRVHGRPTAWLLPRSRRITAAWIDARRAELQAELPA